MSYSCSYFIHEDDTLYQAQVNKVDYSCICGISTYLHVPLPSIMEFLIFITFL